MELGAADRPEHSELFQAGTDHGLAASFDYAGTDEEVLLAELWAAHPLSISLKVIGLDANLLENVSIG